MLSPLRRNVRALSTALRLLRGCAPCLTAGRNGKDGVAALPGSRKSGAARLAIAASLCAAIFLAA